MAQRFLSLCVLVVALLAATCLAELGDFDDPIVLTPGDSYEGSTVGKTQVGDGCSFLGDYTAGAVYFRVDAAPEYVLTLSTCGDATNFDTALLNFALYDGYGIFCENVATASPCDNYGGVSLTLSHGETQLSSLDNFTFLIAVTGLGAAEGDFVLSLQGEIPDESWDECFESLEIIGPQSFMGRIYADGSGTPICGIDSQTSVAWFSYAAAGRAASTGGGDSHTVVITTCSEDTDFDTVLFMTAEAMECDSLQCVEVSDNFCMDDTDGTSTGSTLIFDTENTPSITFGVTGKGSSSGVYRITISEEVDEVQDPCAEYLCGDECSNPIPLTVGESYTYIQETSSLAGESICGVIEPDSYVMWYRIISPITTPVTISTCSFFFSEVDTVIAVVDGCDTLSCIAYNDDAPCPNSSGASALTFNAVAHREYFVALSTYDHDVGSVEILVEADLEE